LRGRQFQRWGPCRQSGRPDSLGEVEDTSKDLLILPSPPSYNQSAAPGVRELNFKRPPWAKSFLFFKKQWLGGTILHLAVEVVPFDSPPRGVQIIRQWETQHRRVEGSQTNLPRGGSLRNSVQWPASGWKSVGLLAAGEIPQDLLPRSFAPNISAARGAVRRILRQRSARSSGCCCPIAARQKPRKAAGYSAPECGGNPPFQRRPLWRGLIAKAVDRAAGGREVPQARL